MVGTSPSRAPRPIAALLALLLVPLTLGLYAAPHVYNVLRVLVKYHPGFRSLHPLEFEKVTNRCVLVFALVLLVPLVRRSGLAAGIAQALRPAGRGTALVCSFAAGLLSMGGLYAIGLAIGGYRLDPENGVTAGFALSTLAGALFIGVFEELFFRGFVFGALNSRGRFWPAALVASAFFAVIHFVRPVAVRMRWAEWSDSAALLGRMFDGFEAARDWPYLCTLFLMGLTLCVLYARRGHLLWCVGLHAGWVLAMQVGNELCDRDFDRYVWLFTQSGYVGKGLIALPVMLAFFVWAVSAVKPAVTRSRAPSL